MVRKLIAAFLLTFAVAFPLMTWACGDGVEVMASGSMAGGSMGGGSAPARRPLPAPAPAPSTARPTKEIPPLLTPKEQPSEEAMTLRLLAHGRQKEIEALKAKLAEVEAKLQQPAPPPAQPANPVAGKDGRDGKDGAPGAPAPPVDLTPVAQAIAEANAKLLAEIKTVVNVPAPVVNIPQQPAPIVNVPPQPNNDAAIKQLADELAKLKAEVAAGPKYFDIVRKK